MISNTKQNWTVGKTVKVGFMTLVVKAAIETPGDYAPDAYVLSNQLGTQLYSFVPHNGLTKITTDEASEMIADQRDVEAGRDHMNAQIAAQRAAVSAVFAANAA